MIYLLIANIAIAIGYGLYLLSFRNLTFFQWNRFYLLGLVLVSLLIPIGVYIDMSFLFVPNDPIMKIHFTTMDEVIVYISKNESTLYLIDVVHYLYWLGVGVASSLVLWRLWKLRKEFQQDTSYSSFSFFKKIVIGTKVRGIKAIEDHERVHVEQGHSYDLILVELVAIFNWFNPVVYWIKKELKFQHECIADEICSLDKISYAELLLSHAMQTDVYMLRHEFSNQSFLKKRIMMLFKNKSKGNRKFLYLSILPLIAVVAFSTIVFNTSKAKEIVNSVESSVENIQVSARDLKDEKQVLSNYPLAKEDTTKNRSNNKQDANSPDLIFKTVEIVPVPHGGMPSFRKWISDNYQFPQAAIDAGVKGTVNISFIVEKDGSLSDLKVEKDLGYGTGEAALEMLRHAPKWSPGIQNGKKVRVDYTLPIKLDLTRD